MMHPPKLPHTMFHAHSSGRPRATAPRRVGFTLVEVIIATLIAAFVLGSLATSIGQLARARDTSKLRLDAHLRADRVLSEMRRDIASVIRHEDLHWTRLHITGSMNRVGPTEEFDRDEILIFTTHLRAVHDMDFQGEGMQHETQYRIETGDYGGALWQRRDSVPDEYPFAGGIATPIATGIIGLTFEAYDGYEWHRNWDSDEFGIPYAVRITVVASGNRNPDELYAAPRATLRTVVALDRVPLPIDMLEDEDEEELDPEELEDVSDPTVAGDRGAQDDQDGRTGRTGRGHQGGPGDQSMPGGQPGRGGQPGSQPGRGGRPDSGGRPGSGGQPAPDRPRRTPGAGGGGGSSRPPSNIAPRRPQ